jgi:hypothetical protein
MDGDAALMRKSMPAALHERRHFWLGATLVIIPLVAVLWLTMNRTDRSSAAGDIDRVAMVETKRASMRPREPAQTPPASSEGEPSDRQKGITLASAHSDTHSEFEPGDPSHDMSPERMRAYRQNHFIGQIDGAILVKDYEGIRRLNAEYRAAYPDDDEPTRQAYDMIADCLEHKTPEPVARARKFWETKRSSRARRDLRKICLE